MNHERILITGANGLLGQALVKHLASSVYYDVLATANNNSPRFHGLSCGYTRLDITDPQALSRIFEDFSPTVVINCAALTDVDRCEVERNTCWIVNAHAVENLARECHAVGAHLIQVSTDFVFDGEDGPYSESARPNPVNFYGRAKHASENAARTAGVGKWTVVRTNVVYGLARTIPRHNFLTWVRQRLMQGESVPAFTDQVRTPTYAGDLAEGIGRIVRFRKSGLYHISGRAVLTMYELASEIARGMGFDPSLVHPTDSSSVSQVAVRPPVTGLIILRAETELGFRPRTIAEALAHMGYQKSGNIYA